MPPTLLSVGSVGATDDSRTPIACQHELAQVLLKAPDFCLFDVNGRPPATACGAQVTTPSLGRRLQQDMSVHRGSRQCESVFRGSASLRSRVAFNLLRFVAVPQPAYLRGVARPAPPRGLLMPTRAPRTSLAAWGERPGAPRQPRQNLHPAGRTHAACNRIASVSRPQPTHCFATHLAHHVDAHDAGAPVGGVTSRIQHLGGRA